MTESSWPSPSHNSRAVGDIEFEQLVAPGLTSALVGTPTDPDLVYGDGSGRVAKVRANRFGLVRGHIWSSGSTDFSKSIAANTSGSTRYDLVVLQYSRSTINVTTVVLTGTPGSGPPSPTRSTGTTGVFEVPLATVRVVNNATTITSDDVVAVAAYLAPQDLVCKESTRPTHAPGRRIYEVDTKNEYVSDGVSWTKHYEDTGWVEMTGTAIGTGWTKVAARVRRINSATHLMFEATRSGDDLPAGTNSSMGTIPAGYRPGFVTHVLGYADGANLVRATIGTNGVITLDNYSFLQVVSGKLVQGGPFQKGVTLTLTPSPYPAS